eukprot:scaffold13475_cov140-Skeletonema_marinoi.AAC.4
MVTRTFVRVRITSLKAAAPKAAAAVSSTAAVDSSINAPDPGKEILKQSQLNSCKHRSCTERAKHPGDAAAVAEERLCDRHSTHVNKAEGGDKKRALPSEDSKEIKKRKRNCHQKSVVVDLSDVPPQQPIPKSRGRIKEGASKYTGVHFRKETNKWHAQITVEGKPCQIGSYGNEEEAAVDYARAVFKYKGQGALEKARKEKQQILHIDLSDVPPQQPIPKSRGRIKEGASKYTGVHFREETNQWHAQITVEGKTCQIGSYDNEEEAAEDYARAVFKYKGQGVLEKARKQNLFVVDLTGVPPKSPITKCAGRIREGASKYSGVTFIKETKKWHSRIVVDGKNQCIGYYDTEEEAAVDYARAVFKYKGGVYQQSLLVDLTGVPPQSPIPKSAGRIREGASKYTGVTFHKQMNKWMAQIMINGKSMCIGFYDNEEEAAVDYARVLCKYKGQDALDKARVIQNTFVVDLADVPPQLPIPKCAGQIKEGASKYTGVYSNKQMKKWQARINIEGKQIFIGTYENEEEAAVDYARAVFKYRSPETLEKLFKHNKKRRVHQKLDLSDVPPQLPIPKRAGQIKEGASKYTGVSFNKHTKKWQARICIEGKHRYVGSYENEEEAAVDYARAVFKYKGKGGQKAICPDSENINDNEKNQPRGTDEHLFEKKRQSGDALVSDMKTDVSPQPPIPEKWRFFQ